MRTITIYVRKSTESEDRQSLSIESQISELQSYAQRMNLQVGSIMTESMSAKAPGRPQFGKILRLIEHGKIKSILCWKLDRLARNPVDGAALIWAFEEGKLESIHTPSNTFRNTPNDKFWLQLEFGMAKKYVDDLSDNVKRGLRARLLKGWSPQRAPLGYLNDSANGTIVIDQDRFFILRKLWHLAITGNYTMRQLHYIACHQFGLRTRGKQNMPGVLLGMSGLYGLFHSPFYYGHIRHMGVLYPGNHTPMVSKAEFEIVQRVISRKTQTRPKRHFFPFTGLMKCGECGAAITAEKKVNRYGYHYTYYRCTKRKVGISCSQKSLEAKQVEQQVLAFFSRLKLHEGLWHWVQQTVQSQIPEKLQEHRSVLRSIESGLTLVKKQLNSLFEMRLSGLIDDKTYSERKLSLLTRLQEYREQVRIGPPEKIIESDRLDSCDEIPERLQSLFCNGSDYVKKMLVRLVCESVFLHSRQIIILASRAFTIS